MLAYTFDRTLDGVLSAVFDAYFRRQQPDELVGEGDVLPLFCDETWHVATTEEKARRVWAGLERRLSREGLRTVTVAWLSESREIYTPLFHYIYKVFTPPLTPPLRGEGSASPSIERNFADADVLYVTNTARRVAHEGLHMMQFVRFQKAKDGTYLGVVAPDCNVLPLVTDHFSDRFRDQPWLLYDARRRYGYYFTPPQTPPLRGEGSACGEGPIRITFADEAELPFSLEDGRLREDVQSENERLMQDLWRTYFKAICIRERTNPKKQLSDMPRRYWRYMTEKQ